MEARVVERVTHCGARGVDGHVGLAEANTAGEGTERHGAGGHSDP
jgi:hypothetical protein